MRRPSHRLTPALLALASCAACTAGARLETHRLAHQPQGSRVTVEMGGSRDSMTGELLEARPDGLLLLTARRTDRNEGLEVSERRLVFVAFAAMKRVELLDASESLAKGETPTPEKLERLRLVSRFPQGLVPELLQQLLQDCGQEEIEVRER